LSAAISSVWLMLRVLIGFCVILLRPMAWRVHRGVMGFMCKSGDRVRSADGLIWRVTEVAGGEAYCVRYLDEDESGPYWIKTFNVVSLTVL